MDGTLTRLKRWALRRLWTEEPAARARRRCRTLIATPFAALAGLAWGVYSAPALATGSALFWGVLGGVALPVLLYVEQRVAPFLFAVAQRRWGAARGGIAAAAMETAAVAGFLYWITRVVGAPVVPQAGTAIGIGAFYAFVMEYVLCGTAASDALALIHGPRSVSGARVEGGSYADTLASRGQHEAAIAAYEEAIARRPREASLHVRLANTLVACHEEERALEALRTGLRRARLSVDEEAFLVRRIFEISETGLGSPLLAYDDLRLLLELQPGSPHADWARARLEEIDRAGDPDPTATRPVG
jgi:tetratricopeptide (TPR) repeat protein